MGPSEFSEALYGRLKLFCKSHLSNKLVVLRQGGEPSNRFEFLKGFLLKLGPTFIHILLIVVLKKSMLKDKFFYMIPPFKSAIVLLNHLKLNPDFLLTIVISKLQIGQNKFGILVVLNLKLVSFAVVAL